MSEGVPEIPPVEVSNVRPVGRVGAIDHVMTAPPVEDGVAVVIAVPLVKVNGLPVYEMVEGAMSLTTIVIVATSLPPVLVAVIE